MKRAQIPICVLALVAGVIAPASSQAPVTAAPAAQTDPQQNTQLAAPLTASAAVEVPTVPPVSEAQALLDFKDSDIKFHLDDLMDILRDRRHEGWVLAAYPDPKTSQPLIGAGFSIDLPARDHPQRDPLNPHPFLEPSSAGLWQAAGLEPARLQGILSRFDQRMGAWTKKKFRANLKSLEPEITEDDANQLLRIGVVQAIYNAKAYCRNFDNLTASQQMAVTQLVYQMGVNLEEFSEFLGLINGDSQDAENAHWKAVQQSLMQSQWARLYRTRAVAVIAMLDPQYEKNPKVAERRVGAVLRPAVAHRRKSKAGPSRQLPSNSDHPARPAHRKSAHSRTKRTA